MPPPEICIIYNPMSGKGKGSQRLQRLRKAFEKNARFVATDAAGHGEELAMNAAKSGYSIVGAAGGDGTVHEVANGILKAGEPKTALAVFPIGSANDYAYTLGLKSDWWLRGISQSSIKQVDVGTIRDLAGRSRYFVNGVGLGFNAAVTMESRRIKRLQGIFLYGLAFVQVMRRQFRHPVMAVTFDGNERKMPTLALSVALGQREGNFLIARDAILDDGWFDYLHVGAISRFEIVRLSPGLLTGKLPAGHPQIRQGRCKTVSVHSESPLAVHLDGELFCTPPDGIISIEIEILAKRLRVQT